jgi:hypothetical protein
VKSAPSANEHQTGANRIGLAGWIAIAVLLALLAGTGAGVYVGWTSHSGDVEIPAWGYMIVGLGVFFAVVIGSGLMGLIFYSSRKGYDEPIRYDSGEGQDRWQDGPPDRR